MDPVTILTGVLSSLVTQAIKREKAGALENILLAGGLGYGAVQGAGLLGMNPDQFATIIATYAFHGLTGDQKPMQALRFAGVDRLLEGVGKAFALASSKDGT